MNPRILGAMIMTANAVVWPEPVTTVFVAAIQSRRVQANDERKLASPFFHQVVTFVDTKQRIVLA
jgi:hypothetical protein